MGFQIDSYSSSLERSADGLAGAGAAGAGAVTSYSGTQGSQVVVSLLI